MGVKPVKFFSNKGPVSSLRPLEEKDIQKRLYGRYHRDSIREAKNPISASKSDLKLEITGLKKERSGAAAFKVFLKKSLELAVMVAKSIPWKFTALISVALIATVVLFQLFSFVAAKSRHAKEERVSQTKASAVERIETRKKREPILKSENSPLSQVTREAKQEKVKYYAVQVATYQREEDALGLQENLKALGFSSAFYLASQSARQRSPLYGVF